MHKSSFFVSIVSLFVLQAFPVPCVEAAATVATPKIHRVGDEGYFSVVLQLPKDAPSGRLAVIARPKGGDVFMVHATLSGQAEARELTVVGRYGRPGNAIVVILSKESFEPAA